MNRGIYLDFFAGGGGASTGCEMALGYSPFCAINHNPQAIRMHKTNHPDTIHVTEDILKVDLKKLINGKHVDLVWASPDCTSHSKAKGGKPREKGLRILPWAVYKHAKDIRPDVIIMENVEEIQQWGPLNEDGKPIKELKGECYQCFVAHMGRGNLEENGLLCGRNEELYKHCKKCIVWKEKYKERLEMDFDSRELVAADYGAATTRKRWYAVFRRDGRPINWPERTHSKDGSGGLKRWIPVSQVLNFSDWGKSIFGRKKPLAENTMKRIAKGLDKFVFKNPKPFLVQVNHSGDNFRGQSINEPLPTITQKHGFGMITPFLIQYHTETRSEEIRGQSAEEPLKTIDTSNRYGMVAAFLTKFYKSGCGQSMLEPIHTITTSPGHFGQVSVLTMKMEELLRAGISEEIAQKCTWVSEFIMEYYGSGTGQEITEPLHTIVTKDRFALITVCGSDYIILDIFLRMLTAEELKLAQGFPRDYIIDRDNTGKSYPVKEQVARIGNSVVPIMAEKLVKANCGYLKIAERMPNMETKEEENGQIRFA